jgi:predicted nucleotidyltransferase
MLDFLGSTSLDDDREGGDLDILVEPTEVTTLFDLAGLKLELEALCLEFA